MEPSIIVAVIFLIILSILDLKTFNLPKGFIPAVLTTSFLIIEFILVGYPQAVYMGLLASLIGMFYLDMDLFQGMADLKIFIAIGMTIPIPLSILIFSVGLLIVSIIYKLIVKKFIKNQEEIPFIPAILITYLGYLAFSFL